MNLSDLRTPGQIDALRSTSDWTGLDVALRRGFRQQVEVAGFLIQRGFAWYPSSDKPVQSSPDVRWVHTQLSLPITHHDFPANGFVEACGRRLGEAVESVLLGTRPALAVPPPFVPDVGHIYGLLTHPAAIHVLRQGDALLPLVLRMKGALCGMGYRGPYGLLASTEDAPHLADCDKIEGLEWSVAPYKFKSVVLFQLTHDVIRMIVARPPTAVPWPLPDQPDNCKAFCIMVPQIREDFEGRVGIAICTD
jgi:hypothetical protein